MNIKDYVTLSAARYWRRGSDDLDAGRLDTLDARCQHGGCVHPCPRGALVRCFWNGPPDRVPLAVFVPVDVDAPSHAPGVVPAGVCWNCDVDSRFLRGCVSVCRHRYRSQTDTGLESADCGLHDSRSAPLSQKQK